MEKGLEYALVALSFFRGRHVPRARFKNPKRKFNRPRQVSLFREYIEAARHYIALARAEGWRGSIVEAVKKERRPG